MCRLCGTVGGLGDPRCGLAALPRPGVPVPQLGQHMDRCRVGTAVGHRDAPAQILRGGLGVFEGDVEVALLQPFVVKGVEEFVLADVLAAAGVGVQQVRVGKRRLRVLVDRGRVGVGGQVVGVEPVVLDVLTVVALFVGQAVGPFLEDRVAPVPQRDSQADDLVAVTPAGQTVFAPPVGAAARVLEREVRPGIPVGAVVLAHRSPGSLAEVGAPAPPIRDAGFDFREALLFGVAHLTGAKARG